MDRDSSARTFGAPTSGAPTSAGPWSAGSRAPAEDAPGAVSRRFGRRAPGSAAPLPAAAAPPVIVRQPEAKARKARAPVRPAKRWLGVALIVAGLSAIYLMQSSTVGLPRCASTDAKRLLVSMTREKLAATKIAFKTVEIDQAGEIPTGASGAHTCKGVILVDGNVIARIVYEISWSVRLVVFNRYQVKIVTATR